MIRFHLCEATISGIATVQLNFVMEHFVTTEVHLRFKMLFQQIEAKQIDRSKKIDGRKIKKEVVKKDKSKYIEGKKRKKWLRRIKANKQRKRKEEVVKKEIYRRKRKEEVVKKEKCKQIEGK